MSPEEIQNLIKKAAEPHLIASAKDANLLLAKLNAVITDLRGRVDELELSSDLHKNLLLKQEDKTDKLKESEWKISEIYKIWKKEKGMLSDIRSVRKALQRHADLLFEQEKYKPRGYGNYPRAV